MKYCISLIIALFCTLATFAQGFKVVVPDQVEEGENFRVQYVVTDAEPSSFRGPKFDSEGFELLAGPYTSTSSSYSMINGKTSSSSSVTYTYTLCALKKGKYKIPSASVKIGSKTLNTETRTLTVTAGSGGSGSRSRNSGGSQQGAVRETEAGTPISAKDLYITATASKTHVYEQEAILLTYKVYYTVSLSALNPSVPDLKGFHVQEVPLPRTKQPTQEKVNGRIYNTIVWSQYVAFPQQTGKLTVPSLTFEATVMQRTRNIDPLDAFFNSGSAFTEVTKKLKTPSIAIQVDPLPAKPANYSGAVGRFSLKSEITPSALKTGEAMTLRLTVQGVGNMKLIKTPEIQAPKDFEAYDPKISDNTQITRNGMEGSKTFEYVFVPRNPGKYKIPAVEFVYFDLDSKSYKTLKTQEYELDIQKGKNTHSGGVSTFDNKEDVKELNTDIDYIKAGKASFSKNDADTFFGSWMYLLDYLLPLAVFVILVIVFRKRAIANANIVRMKTKRANKMARKRLRTAKKLMEAQKKTEFYDEVMRALYGYVSDKLSIPVAELNKENIAGKLATHHLSEELIHSVISTLDECEFARFAPVDSGNTLEKFYNQVISLIENVEDSMKK